MYHLLLDASVSATDASATVAVQGWEQRQYVIAQFELVSGTCTCEIQGRISSDFPFVTVYEFTGDEAKQVTAMPQMRFYVTASSSGVVLAGLEG